MIVACPHCSAVYELPRHLLGPGGAAVRCPHCTEEFTLGVDGEVVAAGVAAPHAAEATAISRARAAEAASGTGASRKAAAARGSEIGSGAARSAAAPRAPATTGRDAVRTTVSMRAPEAALGSGAARAAGAGAADRTGTASDAQAVARRVLEELMVRKGTAMADANARGRLLSEFGPELAAAFEQYRKESGGTGNPAPFREVLRERWGIDLTPRG